jgi:hypothetical protein
VRGRCDSSASDNLMAPSVPILLAVLGENEINHCISYPRD